MAHARTTQWVFRDQTFGSIIHEIWSDSGMTSRQFAEKLGVKQPRVFEIFRQESMTERVFDRCLVALGVTLEVKIRRLP